jgi:hypothetical protein
MMTHDGRIVLVDFGAARQDLSTLGTERNKKSTSAFTMEYAPPELIGGQPVSAASDLFELGMMLYEMLTGARPESSWNRLLRDNWSGAGTLEKPWRELVAASLRLRPEQRPQSVTAWWQTYTDFAANSAAKQQPQPGRQLPGTQRESFQQTPPPATAQVLAAGRSDWMQEDYRPLSGATGTAMEFNPSQLRFTQKPDRHLWMRWSALTALGLGIGSLLGGAISRWVGLENWLSILIGTFIAGSSLGVLQWLILRAFLPRAYWWILATSMGAIAGGFPGWLIFRFVFTSFNRNTSVLPWLVALGIYLTGIGALQWVILRKHATKKIPIPWIMVPPVSAVLVLSGMVAVKGVGVFLPWMISAGGFGALQGMILANCLRSLSQKPG